MAAHGLGHLAAAPGHDDQRARRDGPPGQGNVDWDTTFDTLKAVGYDGWLTVEAFGNFLPNLAAATKIWRPLFDSEEELAVEALDFLKEKSARR